MIDNIRDLTIQYMMHTSVTSHIRMVNLHMGTAFIYTIKLLLAFLGLLSVGFSHYVMGTTIVNQPWDKRRMLWHTGIMASQLVLAKIFNVLLGGGAGAMLSLLTMVMLVFLLYGVRGKAGFVLSLKMLLSVLMMEIVCSVLMYGIAAVLPVSPEEMAFMELADLLELKTLLWSTGLTNVTSLMIAGVVYVFRNRRSLVKRPTGTRPRRPFGLYIRMISMIVIGVAVISLMTTLMKRVMESGLFVELYGIYIALLMLIAFFLLIGLSYFVQDIRYLQQLRRNETLEQQQAMNASLLSNLRFFRHNTVNMLYGFEGAILSGDTGTIKSYYREMTEKCALVNNENIVALERIANPAVSALLLRAVERARQESLPIQLYVQNGLRIGKGLSDSDLCEVMGVLLDNAIEAAVQATVKLVTVEMRNIDNAMELIVKNTYAGTVTEAQLLNGATSTKPGHSGHGLQSVRDILARNRKAFLNLHVSSQYVSMQLFVNQ